MLKMLKQRNVDLKNPNKYHLNTKQIHRKSNKFSNNISSKSLDKQHSLCYNIMGN